MTLNLNLPLSQQCQELRDKYSIEANGMHLIIEQCKKTAP